MSKPYTFAPFIEGAPVIQEQLSANHRELSEAVYDVEWRQLNENVVGIAEIGSLGSSTFKEETAAQSVYEAATSWIVWDTDQGSSNTTPIANIYPADYPATGWVEVASLNTNFKAATITIPAFAGVACGGFCVDSEIRTSAATPVTTTDQPYPNRDLYWEFAVFANGVKVAQGPRHYAGRHSHYIPFQFFTPAESVEITLQVSIYFGQQQFLNATAIQREPFSLYGIISHARVTRF